MQNKHYFFSFLGIPTYGEGGGQAGWAKFPTFTENLFLGLPLSLVQRFFVHEHLNMNPIPLVWNAPIKRIIWIQNCYGLVCDWIEICVWCDQCWGWSAIVSRPQRVIRQVTEVNQRSQDQSSTSSSVPPTSGTSWINRMLSQLLSNNRHSS